MKNIKIYCYEMLAIVAIGCFFMTCTKENSSTKPELLNYLSFTAIPLVENPNQIVVNNTTPPNHSFWSIWDFGNGIRSINKETDTVQYAKKGEYRIKLTAFNHGDSMSTSQIVTIENDAVEKPVPSFTITPVSGDPNKIVIKNTTPKPYSSLSWDFGNGSSSNEESDTILYVLKGSYPIKLTVTNRGGTTSTGKKIVVEDNAIGYNVVKDGGMPDGLAWTVIKLNDDMPAINFTSDGVVVTDNEDKTATNSAIYQAIHVESGLTYKFSAHVKGEGMDGAWINVFLMSKEPKENKKYAEDNDAFTELNAWEGCGKTSFDGDVVELSCVGPAKDNQGEITFQESGTIYLLFTVGSSQKPTNSHTLGDGGVTISDVKLVIQ